MKYTIEEIINQRIGLKPMTEEQFNKLYKVLGDRYPEKTDNSFYFRSDRYYRLFPDFIDRFGANSISYQLEGGNWNCTKEIDFEQINFEDMDFLIERGNRTPDNDADWKDFIDWLNKTFGCLFDGNVDNYYGVIKNRHKHLYSPEPNVPIITLEDWKKRYKNKDSMEDKKIIGYKVPTDLFKGRLKSGVVVYTKNKGDYTYDIDGVFKLPIEIVESWEPVYESLEEVINMGEFSITIKDGKAYHKTEDVTGFIKELVKKFEGLSFGLTYHTPINLDKLEFRFVGCEKSTTTYNQWLEIYKKLK